MNKKLHLILFFLLFGLLAQEKANPRITWGKAHKMAPFSSFFAEDEQYLYAYKTNFPNQFQQITLVVLDKNNLQMEEIPLPLQINAKGQLSFLKISKKEDKIFLFCQLFLDEKKEVALWAEIFDLKGKVLKQAQLIDTLPILQLKDRSVYYQFGISAKSTFVIGNAISLHIDGKPGFFIKTFDENLSKTSEHFFPIPNQQTDILLDKIAQDKQENIYVLGYELNRFSSAYSKKILPEVYKLFVIHPKQEIKEFHLDIQKKYLAATEFLLDPQTGEIIITGFYAKDKIAEYTGLFVLKMKNDSLNEGENAGIEQAHFTKIPPSFFAADNKNKANKNLQQYELEGVFLQNGNIHLLAQQKYIESVHRISGFDVNYFQDFYYHFLNIGYFILDPNGKLIASYKIPKKQVTINDEGKYLGYLLIQNMDMFESEGNRGRAHCL